MEPHARYRIEGERTCIDIRLRSAQQLFDHRDPAPFRERDLDEDAVEYLLGAVGDLPRAHLLKVVFWLPPQRDESLSDDEICASVRAHFGYERDKLQRGIRLVLHRGQQLLWIGLSVLVLCLALSELIVKTESRTWLRMLREGLTITGWVAMWRPIEALLYDWWPLVHQRRTVDRLLAAELEVRKDAG